MQVFWERGYAATSVQDLVEGTGLSRSSLYNTFDNKQGLFLQALGRYQAVTSANVELLAGPGPAKELIRQLLMRVAQEEMSDPLQRGCLVANASLELAGQDMSVADLVACNFQRLINALEATIKRGQETGEIAATKNAHALSWFFLNTMQGMRVVSKGSAMHQRQHCLLDVIEVAISTL